MKKKKKRDGKGSSKNKKKKLDPKEQFIPIAKGLVWSFAGVILAILDAFDFLMFIGIILAVGGVIMALKEFNKWQSRQ